MSDEDSNLYWELLAGRVSRGAFLRRGAAVGLSAPTLAAILAACGGNSSSSSGSNATSTATQVGTATTTPAPTGELDQLKWGLFYEPGRWIGSIATTTRRTRSSRTSPRA